MVTAFVLIGAILVVAVLYVLLPVMWGAYRRASFETPVRCPDTGEPAVLRFDAGHAAWTAAFGRPRLRIEDCSLWSRKKHCEQGCLEDASRARTWAGS